MSSPTGRAVCAFLLVSLALAAFAFGLAQTRSTTTEVRVSARQLDNGYFELALQQRDGSSWGGRQFVERRYFPSAPGHHRWMNSAPFTVSAEVPSPGQPSADELMQAEAGSDPSTVPSDRFRDGRAPPTLTEWGLSPLAEALISRTMPRSTWVAWQIQRTGSLSEMHVTCFTGSGGVYFELGGGSWIQTTASSVMVEAARWLYDSRLESFAWALEVLCGVDAVDHLPDAPAGLPEWGNLFTPGAESVTGNYAMRHRVGSNWHALQMYRSDGPDAWATCRDDRDVIYSKIEGGEWSRTNAWELSALFSFAPWYFNAVALQDLGRACHVPVAHIVATLAPGADTEPETAFGTAIMSNRRGPALPHTKEQIVIKWGAHQPRNWLAMIRIYEQDASAVRRLLAPGPVSLSIGGRSFTFTVPNHSHPSSTAGLVNRAYPAGTEAVLSGSEAHAFYCAAKGGSVAFSAAMHLTGETVSATIPVSAIAIDSGDLCDATGAPADREPTLQIRVKPGVAMSASVPSPTGLATLSLSCTPGDPVARMSVSFVLHDQSYDLNPERPTGMYGYFISPSVQLHFFNIQDAKHASLAGAEAISFLHAAIDDDTAGRAFSIRLPIGESGSITPEFPFSSGLRDRLRGCLTQIETID